MHTFTVIDYFYYIKSLNIYLYLIETARHSILITSTYFLWQLGMVGRQNVFTFIKKILSLGGFSNSSIVLTMFHVLMKVIIV